ncbi:MAG: transporter, partial [Pseudarthrobacter sp.]|nr:transporter [Pseudarthrobacter sp.]
MSASITAPTYDLKKVRKTAGASFIGTMAEYYDFFIYGTASALVFNKIFFPDIDPLLGTLAAFSTYAVGFFARPLGGIVWGHIGDRIGRKKALVWTLLITGLGTFAIGLMPTYETIGLWAAVILVFVRLIQGFGVGGEQGGAVLLTAEAAPPNRRGFFASLVQMGSPAAYLVPS